MNHVLRAAMARSLREAIASGPSRVEQAPVDTLCPWTPHDGPQRQFYESRADEVLYGGAKGGGKSMCAVGLLLPFMGHPDFRALVLRRETTGLKDIVGKAKKILMFGDRATRRPYAPGVPGCRFVGAGGVSGAAVAYAPSGATIHFGHCKGIDDWKQYQGQEFHAVVFEELTQFELSQYREIKSCVRSGVAGLPRIVRSTANPGGVGHEFVFHRWRFWFDPAATISGREPRIDPITEEVLPPAAPGEVLHIRKEDDDSESVFTAPQFDEQGNPTTTSRTFIPARLEDNPTLVIEDPSYRLKLLDFDVVRREQLLRGNWLIRPAAGMYFKRKWVTVVERGPEWPVARLRYWDRAAGEPTAEAPDPDWTVGTRWAVDKDGIAYVEHQERFRASPLQVKKRIRALADEDAKLVGGCAVALEQDPAAAGKFEIAEYLQYLAPHEVIVVPKRPGDDKEAWFRPCSRACENETVRVVKGSWNESAFAELEAFPFGRNDDIVDTWGGGYTRVHVMARRGRVASAASDAARTEQRGTSMHKQGGGF